MPAHETKAYQIDDQLELERDCALAQSRPIPSCLQMHNLNAEKDWFVPHIQLTHGMRFATMWYVRPAKAQTSLRMRAV